MTGEELIQRYRAGEREFRGADLRGAKLAEAHLSGIDLREANLNGALLSGANLRRANLTNADLSDVYAFGVNLEKANLSGANLQDAVLWDAALYEARLWGANLCRADLRGAGLIEADLTGSDLSEANLKGTNLMRSNASGVLAPIYAWLQIIRGQQREWHPHHPGRTNLSKACLIEADLWSSDLRRAHFEHTDLTGAVWNKSARWPRGFKPEMRRSHVAAPIITSERRDSFSGRSLEELQKAILAAEEEGADSLPRLLSYSLLFAALKFPTPEETSGSRRWQARALLALGKALVLVGIYEGTEEIIRKAQDARGLAGDLKEDFLEADLVATLAEQGGVYEARTIAEKLWGRRSNIPSNRFCTASLLGRIGETWAREGKEKLAESICADAIHNLELGREALQLKEKQPSRK